MPFSETYSNVTRKLYLILFLYKSPLQSSVSYQSTVKSETAVKTIASLIIIDRISRHFVVTLYRLINSFPQCTNFARILRIGVQTGANLTVSSSN